MKIGYALPHRKDKFVTCLFCEISKTLFGGGGDDDDYHHHHVPIAVPFN
jgi:hypothetical protein